MRLHRFFTSETVGNRNELTIRNAELVSQLRHVFRLKKTDHIVVFDGSGSEYDCAIADYVGETALVLDVRASARCRYMPPRRLYLCAAIVKKDNFETIVEKATELGVTDIIPVIAERSEKKAVNDSRLKKIAVEASEQSGRGDVPVVHPIMKLGGLVPLSKHFTFVKRLEEGTSGSPEKVEVESIAFHTEGDTFSRKDLSKGSPLAIFIGPEGGWSPDEIAMFHKNDVAIRCLGLQVLRAETAVISALSQVVFND
jgi:16S rRNA (uracil1498-N3)-methyltransferase